MKTLLDDPKFAALLTDAKSEHEKFILIGQIIVTEYPKPLFSFPGVPRDIIVKALAATCSTEEEIKRLLYKSGLGDTNVLIMPKPKDEKGNRAMELCQIMSGILNKEGLPCMIAFWPDE